MKTKTNILHILPHAGGGVGSVMRALFTAETASNSPFSHKVASLEYLNERTKKHFNEHGIAWIDEVAFKHREDLNRLLTQADVVLVHWWNHPLVLRFLYQDMPPVRLLIWSHVNGYFAPQIFFPELLEMPDLFIFTSATSLDAPAVLNLSDTSRQKMRVIRSCLGVPSGAQHMPVKTGPFCAGYVGTVESVKMHSDFLTMCADAQMPAPCIVAGGADHEKLRQKAAALNMADRFDILGPVPDATDIFRKIHAFAYPLSPRHYGTGEQVIIEAMAFGAVPVVLANPPEKTLIRHGETGLIAQDASEFSAALRQLRDDPTQRITLAEGGRRFVLEECGIEHSLRAFHDMFQLALSIPKQPRKLQLQSIPGVKSGSALHLFLASLGETPEKDTLEKAVRLNRIDQLPEEFLSKTRGSSFHYLSMLEKDPELEALCNIITMSRN
ncbi:MAG: hypothetical protein CVU52_11435 [Deltaproteobacteria bacterium HGW-Deltaproteobacteria-10]|nr:MAG: hypothetical protein CVU52_11435 [Deltaproteobacteria bacterium HGW-Deltaproteobacteria-10]